MRGGIGPVEALGDEVGQVVGATAGADELEVDGGDRAVWLEEQVVGPAVAVDHRGRLGGEIVEQAGHDGGPPRADLLDRPAGSSSSALSFSHPSANTIGSTAL